MVISPLPKSANPSSLSISMGHVEVIISFLNLYFHFSLVDFHPPSDYCGTTATIRGNQIESFLFLSKSYFSLALLPITILELFPKSELEGTFQLKYCQQMLPYHLNTRHSHHIKPILQKTKTSSNN